MMCQLRAFSPIKLLVNLFLEVSSVYILIHNLSFSELFESRLYISCPFTQVIPQYLLRMYFSVYFCNHSTFIKYGKFNHDTML